MSDAPETWTLKGFLEHFGFVHKKMRDHAFAWVLGAGASRSSGIPTGGELVARWLRELHVRLDTTNSLLEAWATADNLGIKNFRYSDAASFYTSIYQRRFCDNPEEGYACLEDLMAGIEPSPGYSILAKLMEQERHRIVITTNFDNLVADALAIYTESYPFVCGHESLTSFVRAAMRRPLVCKIHRDLLLGPQNDPRSLRRLHEAWAGTLRALLSHHTPIFVGYGGNDDSLMDLLESLEHGEIMGRMIWCYYEKSTPSDRIQSLVTQHHGVLVPVPDFDVLMVLLGAKMGIEPLDNVLGERARRRLSKYQERILALDAVRYPDLIPALESAFDRANIGWWGVELKAQAESNHETRESVYHQGIRQYPQSAHLFWYFAFFMHSTRRNAAEAEKLYRRALELDPTNAAATASFAELLWRTRKTDEAEKLLRRAQELDPENTTVMLQLACFWRVVRRNADEEEKLCRRGLERNPKNINAMVNLAELLWRTRKNTDEAEKLLRRAQELEPENTNAMSSLAHVLTSGMADEAELLYRRLVELKPSDPIFRTNFADFLWRERRKAPDEEMERHYQRALELDPTDFHAPGRYAAFLLSQGRFHEALTMAERAHATDNQWVGTEACRCEFLLCTGLAERCVGRDDKIAIGQFKTLLQNGFVPSVRPFNRVIESVKETLPKADLVMYEAMAAALLGGTTTKDLERLDRWQSLAPVPLGPTRVH